MSEVIASYASLLPLRYEQRWQEALLDIVERRKLGNVASASFVSLVRFLEEATAAGRGAFAHARILVIGAAPGTGKSHFGAWLGSNGWVPILRYKDRARRAREREGFDGHFVSPEEFRAMEQEGLLIGVSESQGERRGYNRAEVLRTVAGGSRCYSAETMRLLPLLAMDEQLRDIPAASVFLLPPSLETLLERIISGMREGEVSEGQELVGLLRTRRVPERLEYAFAALADSIKTSDPRRLYLADCYVVYDDPGRVSRVLELG